MVSCILTAFDVNGAIRQQPLAQQWGPKPIQVPGGRQTLSTQGHSLQRGFRWGLEEAGRQESGRELSEHIIREFEVLAIVGPLPAPTKKKS